MSGSYPFGSAGRKLEIALDAADKLGQVFLPAMEKIYKIELGENDLGQLLDGLGIRAESWSRTAEYLRTGELPEGELFIIEECSDEIEAEELAARYQTIIKSIYHQMEAQP